MTSSTPSRSAVSLAAVVVVILGLKFAGGVILPVLSAVFIAVVSMPVLGALERLKVPYALAGLLTLLLDVAVLAGIVALLATSISGLEDALPRYAEGLHDRVADVERWMRALGMPRRNADLERLVALDDVRAMATTLVSELTQVASNAMLVVLLVGFVIFELRAYERKLELLLGSHDELERFADAARRVQRYLVAKTGISVIVGVCVWLALTLVGVDFPLLWALVTFMMNFVPTIGPLLAMAPSVFLAFLTLGPGGAVAALLSQLTIHVIVGNLIEPRVMGEAVGISTLIVLVSMLFWGWLWGPVGALFAVPLTRLLVSVLELSPETRWLAVLLASNDWAEEKSREWGWISATEKRAGASLPPPRDDTSSEPPNEATSSTRDAAE